MRRSVLNWSEMGKKKISSSREMTVGEFDKLYKIAVSNSRDNIWDCISHSFHFGFMVGYRQAKEEQKKHNK